MFHAEIITKWILWVAKYSLLVQQWFSYTSNAQFYRCSVSENNFIDPKQSELIMDLWIQKLLAKSFIQNIHVPDAQHFTNPWMMGFSNSLIVQSSVASGKWRFSKVSSGGRPSQFYGELNFDLAFASNCHLCSWCWKWMLDVVLPHMFDRGRSWVAGIFHQKLRVMVPGYLMLGI